MPQKALTSFTVSDATHIVSLRVTHSY